MKLLTFRTGFSSILSNVHFKCVWFRFVVNISGILYNICRLGKLLMKWIKCIFLTLYSHTKKINLASLILLCLLLYLWLFTCFRCFECANVFHRFLGHPAWSSQWSESSVYVCISGTPCMIISMKWIKCIYFRHPACICNILMKWIKCIFVRFESTACQDVRLSLRINGGSAENEAVRRRYII